MILILAAGFCGGIIRGLVGFIKHQFSYSNVSFRLPYFFAMMFLSGVVGMAAAFVFNGGAIFAFVVGYAGGDFIENIYKTATKQPSIYPTK